MMTIGTWGFRGAADFFVDNPDDWDWIHDAFDERRRAPGL